MVNDNSMGQQSVSELVSSDLDGVLDKGKAMVALLEQGDTGAASTLLDELTKLRERDLFRELGQLTRHLHEALQSVRLSDEVSGLVEEFPDAKQRLGYVVRLTEEAANKTLSIIEGLMPEAKSASVQAEQLLKDLRVSTLDAGDTNSLHDRIGQFLQQQANSSLHNALSEIMMAQDFQDITGQIIQRVITLVEETETGLVDILRKNPFPEHAADADKETKVDFLNGPAVPGISTENRVETQDDVDQLLAEFGF